jgi:hypothetical protein
MRVMGSKVLGAQQGPQQIAKEAGRDGGAQDQVEHARQTFSQVAAYALIRPKKPSPRASSRMSIIELNSRDGEQEAPDQGFLLLRPRCAKYRCEIPFRIIKNS